MIYLNLISPDQRKILRTQKIYALIGNVLGLLVVYSLIISSVLLYLDKSIVKLKNDLESKKQEIQTKDRVINAKVDELNGQIEVLNQIRQQFFDWPLYLAELSKLTPADVSLNEINSNLENRDFLLHGYAKTREGLIEFEKNLKSSPLLEEINIPLSNFLSQKEITFEITGKIKQL